MLIDVQATQLSDCATKIIVKELSVTESWNSLGWKAPVKVI